MKVYIGMSKTLASFPLKFCWQLIVVGISLIVIGLSIIFQITSISSSTLPLLIAIITGGMRLFIKFYLNSLRVIWVQIH